MDSNKYIIALDQGTTSTRAIIFDKEGEIVSSAQIEFKQICNHDGWVEHNPEEIWETTMDVLKRAIRKAGKEACDFVALGITNQRETAVLWDKETGKPLYNAICWQSRQSKEICEDLINKGYKDFLHKKTGLIINPYFSASKIKWMFDNVPGIREKAIEGKVLFGTIDSFLAYRLSGGKLHITDITNASRTMLFNINTQQWDDEILDLFDIPKSILPKVVSNSEVYGVATSLKEINPELNVPIASLIGDQQSSMFGQCCFEKGDIKNTYGTGCFMLMNTLDKPVYSNNGLLTTIAWKFGEKTVYALEGSVFVAGSAIQWLRDGMRMFVKSSDSEFYANRVGGSFGVYVVPAFVGLGSPYWDDDARGSVFGLTRATKKEHFITATLESIAYQSKDVMELMRKESNISFQSLAVDGGASSNDYLMQFQADILGIKVKRPGCLETTALGAAFMAGLAVGVYKDIDELYRIRSIERTFFSDITEEERNKKYNGWLAAVNATRMFKN